MGNLIRLENKIFFNNSTSELIGLGSTSISKAIDYTAIDGDFVLVTTAAVNVTITLPPVATSIDSIITIKKVDSGAANVIIDGNAAELIDGAATQTITTQWTSITIQSDGVSWFIK